MNSIDLYFVPIYEFYADASLLEEVTEQVKNLEWEDNGSNEMSKNSFYNEKLFVWFSDCLEQVREKYYSDSLKLEITACWANKAGFLEKHLIHKHINAIVSGAFYLDNYNSLLEFSIQDPWLTVQNANILGIGKNRGTQFIKASIQPKKGQLILFPSVFEHEVLPNKEKKTRYSISFNAFTSGMFIPFDVKSADLEIKCNGMFKK